MSFLQKWNRFWFMRSMNWFDLLCIVCLAVMAQDSWWWILALLPLNLFSVHMEQKIKGESHD